MSNLQSPYSRLSPDEVLRSNLLGTEYDAQPSGSAPVSPVASNVPSPTLLQRRTTQGRSTGSVPAQQHFRQQAEARRRQRERRSQSPEGVPEAIGQRAQAVDSTPQVNRTRSSTQRRFVLAIDFGTTRTGIAYSSGPLPIDSKDVHLLKDFGGSMRNELKVKSAVSYEHTQQEVKEWGFDIDHSRIAMINTKLELESLDTRFEELDLMLQLLRRTDFLKIDRVMRNDEFDGFSSKPPEEIVSDFLKKVFVRTHSQISGSIAALSATDTPVDIVMTVPVAWSAEARNTLFRAIRRAGFNDRSYPTLSETIVVSEPEAAVHSTMRELLASKALKIEDRDCFVLCDAGGGTVDVVAFQVKASQSRFPWLFDIKTDATGGQFGSAIIDTQFKRWLRKRVLNLDQYNKLDPANRSHDEDISPHGGETGAMRELIRRFEDHKYTFEQDQQQDIVIDLPAPLDGITVEGYVDQGALRIKHSTMAHFMDHCVDKVVRLVDDQIRMIHQKAGLRPRELLLVGGFGGSPYLQSALRDALQGNDGISRIGISVHVPTVTLQTTAVVRGAVIYGLEREQHGGAVCLLPIKRSYGILMNGRFKWLINEDDSVSLGQSRTITTRQWSPTVAKDSREYCVWSYQKRKPDDILPRTWYESRNDLPHRLTRFAEVKQEAEVVPPTGWASRFRRSAFRWRFTIRDTNSLIVEILEGGRNKNNALKGCECKLDVRFPSSVGRRTNPYINGENHIP